MKGLSPIKRYTIVDKFTNQLPTLKKYGPLSTEDETAPVKSEHCCQKRQHKSHTRLEKLNRTHVTMRMPIHFNRRD